MDPDCQTGYTEVKPDNSFTYEKSNYGNVAVTGDPAGFRPAGHHSHRDTGQCDPVAN